MVQHCKTRKITKTRKKEDNLKSSFIFLKANKIVDYIPKSDIKFIYVSILSHGEVYLPINWHTTVKNNNK